MRSAPHGPRATSSWRGSDSDRTLLQLRAQLRQPHVAGIEHLDSLHQLERLASLAELAAQPREREDEVEVARVTFDEASQAFRGETQLAELEARLHEAVERRLAVRV